MTEQQSPKGSSGNIFIINLPSRVLTQMESIFGTQADFTQLQSDWLISNITCTKYRNY